MDSGNGIITLLRRGLRCTLISWGLLASPLASAGVIAVAEANVSITLAVATLNGSNVDLTDLDLSLTFSSVETQTISGEASGFAQATSTLTAADPNHLVIGDSLNINAIASGNAQNGGSFIFASDGEWFLSITNNSDISRSLLVVFDVVNSLTGEILLDNPKPAPIPGTGGVGPGGIGVGGSVGTGTGGTTTVDDSEFDTGSLSSRFSGNNVSVIGTGGSSTGTDPDTLQVSFFVSDLAAHTSKIFASEPVEVGVAGRAAVNAIPETPTLLLLMCGMPLLLAQRSRYKP